MATTAARRTSSRHHRARGQIIAVAAVAMVVIVGFAGIAVDGARAYTARIDTQAAADAAALATADLWGWELDGQGYDPPSNPALFPPPSDPVVGQAQLFAGLNGAPTTLLCTLGSGGSRPLHVVLYDRLPGGCATPSGWRYRVEVVIPASSPPPGCTEEDPNFCVEIDVSEVMPNVLAGVVGAPSTTVSATAVALGVDQHLET